jgi:HK97 family phage prohead protease
MDYIETKVNKYENVLSKFSVAEGKREFIAMITTNGVDRDGDVIDPKGMDLKNFKLNPVIMLNHESWELPIGKAQWLRAHTDGDGKSGIMAKGFISDKTQKAVEAFGLMQDGVLTTTSIGFGIKEGGARPPTEEETKAFPGIKRMITKTELYEFSIVGVPANTDAVIQQVSKSHNLPEWLGVKEKTVPIGRVDTTPIVETEPVIQLMPMIKTEKVVSLERLIDPETVKRQAAADVAEEYQVVVLGKVS